MSIKIKIARPVCTKSMKLKVKMLRTKNYSFGKGNLLRGDFSWWGNEQGLKFLVYGQCLIKVPGTITSFKKKILNQTRKALSVTIIVKSTPSPLLKFLEFSFSLLQRRWEVDETMSCPLNENFLYIILIKTQFYSLSFSASIRKIKT